MRRGLGEPMLERAMLNFALLGAEWVLWLLVALSILCVFVTAERLFYMAANQAPVAAFEAALGAFLAGGPREALHASLAAMRGLEARVILAGLDAKNDDAAESAMAGTLMFERLRMERGLIIVGTVASTAAFIGLFGTVLGIIQAFHEMSLEKVNDGGKAVMAAISEALVSTAVALMVAIPAVVLYNYLSRRTRELASRADSLAQLVVARLRSTDA
jgi:biopolymer transport protein ExbB